MEVERFTYRGCEIIIENDEHSESPRDWENLGTMICFRGRCRLGDAHDLLQHQFSGWEDLKRYLTEVHGPAMFLPIYMYEHGGRELSTEPFSCPWDSGQVGWIFVTGERMRAEYGENPDMETVEKALIQEVATYNQWISGDVYGYLVKGPADAWCPECGHKFERKILDSCRGIYGEENARRQAKAVVDAEFPEETS